MKIENKQKIKNVTVFVFGLLIIGLILFRVFGNKIENIDSIYKMIIPVAIALCFVLSVLFFKFTKKKIFLTVFLLFLVALAFCLSFLKPEMLEYTIKFKVGEEQKIVVLALADILFLLAQLALVIYTLFVVKGVGLKIISLGVRVAVSVISCVVLKNYFEIALPQILYIVSLSNLACTILFLCFDIKNNWLLIFGVLFIALAVCVMAFKTGQLDVFATWTGKIAEFLRTQNVEEWLFVAGTFFVSASSVMGDKQSN